MVDEANEAKPGSEESGAVEDRAQDLDSLLSEYDNEDKPAPKQEEKPDDYGKRAYEMLRADQERKAQEAYRKDMDSAIKTMRSVIGREDFDADVLEAFLEGEARRDKRIASAFQARYDKPQSWESVVKAVAKKAQRNFTGHDQDVSDSLDAVRAAVKSNSSDGPSDDQFSMEKLSQMSDWEFQRAVKEYAKSRR